MATNSPASKIKSKLKKIFPNTKFSVTTPDYRSTKVHVKWDMEIGSSLTWNAIKAVTDKYNTHPTINNSGVELLPNFSKERKDWTLECIKNLPVEGEEKYDEIKRYNHYIKNGVCNNLD
jgi:hypothetical protein